MRSERLTWPDHHMTLAMVTAQRSPDPNTQVGCSIVDANNRVVSMGYNSTPRKINPALIPWSRSGNPEETKYPFIVHAERNAILNAPSGVRGCTLFVTLYPCNECTKEIIQSGISKVVYLNNLYPDSWEVKTSSWMLETAGIECLKHNWDPAASALLTKSLTVAKP